MSHRLCRDEGCDAWLGLREFAFDLSLRAEYGEANTESERLPLAAELLTTCGAGEGVPSVKCMKGNGTE